LAAINNPAMRFAVLGAALVHSLAFSINGQSLQPQKLSSKHDLAKFLFAMGSAPRPQRAAASVRTQPPSMGPGSWPKDVDRNKLRQALIDRGFKPELADEPWRSEVGWALFMNELGMSYRMNPVVSKAEEAYSDGYFTPTIFQLFSNPGSLANNFRANLVRAAKDPFDGSLISISSDKSGLRSWGKYSEVESRKFKPPKGYTQRGLAGSGFFGLGRMDVPPRDTWP
jgi:hypothetical protein